MCYCIDEVHVSLSKKLKGEIFQRWTNIYKYQEKVTL